jgi:ABC-type transport system substrate-binding protein
MRNRRLAAALLTAGLVGCTTAPQPSPSRAAPVQAASEIVIGLVTPPFAPSPFFTISNTTAAGFRPPGARPDLAMQLVYNALYRYDDSLAPVPDLAAEPCEVAADQVTITCRLVEATFHNGTPLTADDVAYTFELGRRHPDCLWAFGECYGEVLESVTTLDERTVEFRLSAPDATFLTLVLPSVAIDSRAVIEAAYAPLAERAPTLDAAEYKAAADAIFGQLASDAPDCETPLARAEALLQAAAVEPLPRDQFNQAGDVFDACMYAEWSAVLLEDLARSLEATGLDAIALAYQALSFNRAPVGTGPWRFVRVEDGSRAIFEAFEAYHRGPPATPRIEIRVIRDWAAAPDAMRSGELHWLTIPLLAPELYEELRGEADLQFAIFPAPAYFMLAYNLREGMLFSDPNLRAAVELCIDKPATVDAATDGRGDVLYSPIDPISWAYQPDLPRPERDVDAARRLIEASGWTSGNDGIYTRDGRRLATDVFTSGDDAQRVEFMDLVAEQVLDCGIELTVIPADTDTVLGPLGTYPHIPGGYEEPFEAVFLGWTHGIDPHDELWHSRTASSAERPQAFNFMGFSNPRVDELLDQGIATYDRRERARIYRELQELLAEEHPVLFGWAAGIQEALDARIGLTDGELNLSSRQWFWQLEKLVLREGAGGG